METWFRKGQKTERGDKPFDFSPSVYVCAKRKQKIILR